MPRKPLIYTSECSYHVMARSNNKEWFYIPKIEAWTIFKQCLNEAQIRYGIKVYLFVLMDNHYHMILQCAEKHNLGEVMAWLQKVVSRNINARANKINHVFGGSYKATVLWHPDAFASSYKYVARNPVKAGISGNVQSYDYSTLVNNSIRISPLNEWSASFPSDRNDLLNWLNDEFDPDEYLFIKKSLTKTVFPASPAPTKKIRQLEFPIIK